MPVKYPLFVREKTIFYFSGRNYALQGVADVTISELFIHELSYFFAFYYMWSLLVLLLLGNP
jgi:uncharacterized membrane protein